jgi:acylphosphatase
MSDTRVGRAFHVTGLVQGVGFRWFARETAVRSGLAGWVANRPDGSVHGEVYGLEVHVTGFIGELERGPTLGRVDRVETRAVDPGTLTRFEIRK